MSAVLVNESLYDIKKITIEMIPVYLIVNNMMNT